MTSKEFVARIVGNPIPSRSHGSISAGGNRIYSYDDVIAERDGNKMYVTTERVSSTTSKHINMVVTEASNQGFTVIPKKI